MLPKRIRLLFVALLTIAPSLFAQPNLIGTWQSKSLNEGTENVVMELIFRDTVNLEMGFITDNKVPNVGRCLSRISVQGTYNFIGPFFLTEIDKNTLNLDIKKLELSGDLAKTVPQDMIPILKEQMKKQMSQSAISLFSDYDGGSMIYVTHEGTNDTISFIMGEEKEAIDLEFVRKK